MKAKQLFFYTLLFLTAVVRAQNIGQIETLYSYEKYDAAKKAALDWIAADPKNGDAYYVAGKLYSKIALDDTTKPSLVDSAEYLFKMGIEMHPKFPYNYIGLIRIAFHKKVTLSEDQFNDMYEEAKDRTSRKDQRLYLEMADACLLAPAENNQIKRFIDEAKKIDRKNTAIFMILGQYYLLQGDATNANQNFQTALDFNPKNVRAAFERGEVYFRANNIAAAEEQYLNAVMMDSLFAPAYVRLAELYYSQKQYTQAVANFEKYTKTAEPSILNQRRFASFLFRAKEYERAIAALQEVLKKESDDATLLRLLAYCYFELKDSVNSANSFEKYFAAARPEMIIYEDYFRYAGQLSKIGKDAEALEYYEKAYAKDTTKKEILSSMALIHSKMKNWKGVIQTVTAKMSTGKDVTANDYFQVGLAYYFDTSYHKSIEMFNKFLEINPKSFAGYRWLSLATAPLDTALREGLSKPIYEKMIELAADPQVTPDPKRVQKDILQAYRYLGAYYVETGDIPKSKEYWLKILELEPENQEIKDILKRKEYQEKKGKK